MFASSVVLRSPVPLSAPAIATALQALPAWRQKTNHVSAIERDYVFPDFPAAMDYMVRVGPVCERMQHHPCWTNVYNRLHVELNTHDAGNKITQRDVDLALEMERIFEGTQQS